MPIGRYLLFAGQSHYANGGWNDFKGVFASVEDARAAFLPYGRDYVGGSPAEDTEEHYNSYGLWYHVIDITTGKTVACLEGSYCGGNPDERED